MRVNASISEPFVLSTYSTSKKLLKNVSNSKKQREHPSVFVTYEQASGSSDGYATVAAQADGVHVLDISTLHPVISHTLGPSTTFACPAITCNIKQGDDNICATYAAIASSSDITADECGCTMWMWRQNLSGRLEDNTSQKKKTTLLQHQISGLYTCDEMPARILAQSPQSELTILDADLNIKKTSPAPQETQSLIRTYCHSRNSCTFLPPQTSPRTGAILVSVDALKNSTRVRVLCVDDSDEVSELGTCSIPLNPDHILDLSCSPSGFMSFLTRDGTWYSYRLEPTDNNFMEPTSISEPFCLTGLSFISKAPNSKEVSLLSLGSSHVLLSAVTNSPTPEIALLLWDLQYSVLLASQALPIPSTLQAKDVAVKLTLVPAWLTQSLLVLSANTSDAGRKYEGTSLRSSVLVVPFTCPATSTIANALGQASSGAKWIAQATSSSVAVPSHDPARTKVLSTMRTAMEKNLPQAGNVAFFEWEKRESKVVADASKNESGPSQAVLSHSFVKDLLATVLQPSKPANTPYSSEVVKYLLNRKVVSTSMLDGGLLAVLRYKNDWQSIETALGHVIDLSEAEILESLQYVVARHRSSAIPQDDNAMEVDSVTDVPSLPSFLSLCVSYTTTPPALRSAIRQSLKEAEDIYAVLKVLENWTKQWSIRDSRLLPSKKDIVKNAHGVFILREKDKTEGTHDLPSLSNILLFLQSLLDASFLTLLQHPPACAVLRRIQAQIEPEIVSIDHMEQLRGPLEMFAKAHMKAIREAGQDKSKKPLGDWRQRRKQAHDQAGLSIGLYQLEELVL